MRSVELQIMKQHASDAPVSAIYGNGFLTHGGAGMLPWDPPSCTYRQKDAKWEHMTAQSQEALISCTLTLLLCNAMYVKNKTLTISDLLNKEQVDLTCLTESWLDDSDVVMLHNLHWLGIKPFFIFRQEDRRKGSISFPWIFLHQ